MVEYLNTPNDRNNPNGGINWAKERAGNGHLLPYKIKYYELGNEIYQGIPQKGILGVDTERYAKDYLKYRNAMKSVDTTILLGAVINSSDRKKISSWNDNLFKIAGQSIDFLVEHTYRPWYTSNDEKVDTNKLFTKTFNSLEEVEKYYKNLSNHFEMVTSRKMFPFSVTEYNGGFVQDRPVPFRYSLGTAIFNAGLLQIFIKPENNILMANYWQFVNIYWGMIKNDQFIDGKGHYVKRPNYYVFEMFNKHFGTKLLDVKVNDLSEKLSTGLKGKTLSVTASKSKDNKKLYVMVLNKNVYEDIGVIIS